MTRGRVGVEMSSLKPSDLTTSAKCSTMNEMQCVRSEATLYVSAACSTDATFGIEMDFVMRSAQMRLSGSIE